MQSSHVLIFYCKRAIEPIVSRLAYHQRHAAALKVELFFRQSPPHRRRLRLPEPTLDPAMLLRPVQAHVESLTLPEPVIGISLEAEPGLPVESQPRFFDRPLPDPHRLSATLARLESLLGPNAVGIPVRSDTHRPDSFRLRPFDPGTWVAARHAPDSPPMFPAPSLPLQRLRPAPVLVVATGPAPHPETKLPMPLAVMSGPHRGRITHASGPFTLSGHWWEKSCAWQQAEWDIELESGHLLRIAFLPPDSWKLEGVYA